MASTYSSNLKIELQATGENAGTWGTITNTNLGTALEQAIVGKADVTFSGTTETLALTDSNSAQDARALYLNLAGTPGGAATLNVPAIEKNYIVKNGTGETVTIKVSGQTGVAIPDGKTALVYNNGTDVVTAVDYIPSLTLGAALPVASGGTGITSFGTGVATFLGTPSSANLAAAVTDETGSGALVFATSPTLVTPVLGTPTSGTLTNCTDLPVSTGISGLGSNVATFLGTPSSANLLAALTDETGTGVAVFGTNPTLTGATMAGELACADQIVSRPTLKDYAIEGQAVGNTGATRTLDLNDANFFSATLDQACTFTFSDPAASGDFCGFVLALTNGGAFVITWPASVDWSEGQSPTLTAAGLDILVFVTYDAGTTWHGMVASTDSQ